MSQQPVAEVDSHIWSRFRRSDARISVGVLVHSPGVPRWLAAVLETAGSVPGIEIRYIFCLPAAISSPAKASPWLFRKLSDWSLAGERDPFEIAEHPTGNSPLIETIRYELGGDGRPGLSAQEKNAIAAANIDVLVCAPSEPLVGNCDNLARLGVWSFRLGDPEFERYRPPYWREVFEGVNVSRLILVQHGDRFDEGHVAADLTAATVPSMRFTMNQVPPLEAAGGILGRCLLKAADLGAALPTGETEQILSPRDQRWPTNLETASFVGKKLFRSFSGRVRFRGRGLNWFSAMRPTGHGTDFLHVNTGLPFQEIPAPTGRNYADPFIVEHKSRHWLFVEDIVLRNNRACLSCMEVLPNGRFGDPVVILDKPYHLSYPHVFEHNSEFFMIPETGGDFSVQLYRAARFPFEWQLETILVSNSELVDTTPLYLDGIWYFFTSALRQPEEAYLFMSSRIDGPWRSHPSNPICSDVRRLRGAGAVFSRGGKLYRPGQDCSIDYGYAVAFHEIHRLNPMEYEERHIGTMEPNWMLGLLRTHTFNFDSNYEVVDGRRMVNTSK